MDSEGGQNLLQSSCFMGLHDNNNNNSKSAKHEGRWMIMSKDVEVDHEGDYTNISLSSSSSSSSLGDSNGSTSSSSELVDDASPSTSLFEFSDLMAQLPIKRGLSNFFRGKSQSFTSLSRVKSIEDLAKKESPYRKKMKACKSYGGGLDGYKSYTLEPKATISKKSSRSSFSSSFPGKRSTFLASSRPPPAPVQKNFRLF